MRRARPTPPAALRRSATPAGSRTAERRCAPARSAPGPGPTAAGVVAILLVALRLAAPSVAAPEPVPRTPVAGAADGAASDAPSAQAVTARVQERYDATSSFTASFEQEMRLEAGGQVLRSSGKVYFQRPGRMRWAYEEPEPQTIVADGKDLWIYQPEEHQVLKTPLRQAFESRTPASFLLGVARIEQDFAPTLLRPAGDGSIRLRLQSRSDQAGSLGTLTLELEPVTFDIRAAIITDSLGNTTRVALKDLRRNLPVAADLFRFEPPYGADVIESPGR